MFRTVITCPLASTSVHYISCLSERVSQDPHLPGKVPLDIPLYSQSPLNDLQEMPYQPQRSLICCGPCNNMGMLAAGNTNLSGVEGLRGLCLGAAKASEVRSKNGREEEQERRKTIL